MLLRGKSCQRHWQRRATERQRWQARPATGRFARSPAINGSRQRQRRHGWRCAELACKSETWCSCCDAWGCKGVRYHGMQWSGRGECEACAPIAAWERIDIRWLEAVRLLGQLSQRHVSHDVTANDKQTSKQTNKQTNKHFLNPNSKTYSRTSARHKATRNTSASGSCSACADAEGCHKTSMEMRCSRVLSHASVLM